MKPHRYVRWPVLTLEQMANEPAPFPRKSAGAPIETSWIDWRLRLTRNLARRSEGRWEPLTRVHRSPDPDADMS
jgi:hypothetical protein